MLENVRLVSRGTARYGRNSCRRFILDLPRAFVARFKQREYMTRCDTAHTCRGRERSPRVCYASPFARRNHDSNS